MKRSLVLFFALFVAFLCASAAHAAPKNAWTTGYPQPGTQTGTISVMGTFTPDPGFTIKNTATVTWWQAGANGGIKYSGFINVNVMTGAWSGTLAGSGLTSGTTYNVIVTCTETNTMAQMFDVITPPAQSQAK